MPSTTRRSVGARVACAVLVTAAGQPGYSWAAQWYADPAISFGAEQNSNITLTTQPHDDVSQLRVTPSIRLGTQTEAAVTDINASSSILRYPGNDQLNRETYDVGVNTRYNGDQLGERHGYSAGMNFAKESLLDGNLYLNPDANPDIGTAQSAVTRRENSLSGGYRWLLSPIALAEIRGEWSETKFDDESDQGYFDFRLFSPAVVVTWIVSDRLRMNTTLSYSNSIFPDTNPAVASAPGSDEPNSHTESKTTSLQLGAIYAMTPTMDINVSVGKRRSRTSSVQSNVPFESESSGTVYNLAYGWRPSDRARLNVSAVQNTTPSGQSAGLILRTFQAGYSYSFTERLSAGLTLNRSRTRSDASTVNFASNQDRDYSQAQTRLDYQFSENWQLGGYFSQARQQYVSDFDSTTNNVFGMTLSWNPTRRYFSR